MATQFRTEIEGMNCGSCVRRIETALLATEGVAKANANLANKTVTVDYDTPATDSYTHLRAHETL